MPNSPSASLNMNSHTRTLKHFPGRHTFHPTHIPTAVYDFSCFGPDDFSRGRKYLIRLSKQNKGSTGESNKFLQVHTETRTCIQTHNHLERKMHKDAINKKTHPYQISQGTRSKVNTFVHLNWQSSLWFSEKELQGLTFQSKQCPYAGSLVIKERCRSDANPFCTIINTLQQHSTMHMHTGIQESTQIHRHMNGKIF